MLDEVIKDPPEAGLVAYVELVAFVTAVEPIAATISAADAAENALDPFPLTKDPEVIDVAPVPPLATGSVPDT